MSTHYLLAKVSYKHANIREQGSIVFLCIQCRKEPEVISATVLNLKSSLIYSFVKHFNKRKVSDRYEVPHMIIKSYVNYNT